MSMKRIILISVIAAFAICSCSLEESLKGYSEGEASFNTELQCDAALRGTYTPLHYIYNLQFFFATEACTDLWSSSSSDQNAQMDITPANPGVASTVWKYAYKGVERANECVEGISASPLKDDVKLPLVAEARVMRALYYYLLTSFFGDVPFYTHSVPTIDKVDSVRYLPRKPAFEIRDALYKELKEEAVPYFNEENGLRCRSNQVKDQHAGYALGLMLMAKMAMWNEDWQAAVDALEMLEDIYGEFSEANYPLKDIWLRNKNIDESIFEIQHSWSPDGAKFYGALAQVLTPKCSGDYIYDGVYLPHLSKFGTSSSPVRATKHYALFRSANNSQTQNTANAQAIFPVMPMKFSNETYPNGSAKRYCGVIDMNAVETGRNYEGKVVDRRTLYTFGMGNIDTGETFAGIKTGGTFYGGEKFWCPDMTANYDSNNYRIFRYADAVLMMAESLCRLGYAQKAVEYLDQVRARAGLEGYSYLSEAEMIKEIQNERARELGGEMHRKFDLVRWGIWYDQTLQFNEQDRVKSNIRECHQYYPIPDTECALSGGILKNEAYL